MEKKNSEVLTQQRQSRTVDFGAGLIIGLLLALGGLLALHDRFCHASDPSVKVVTVTKVVHHTRVVEKQVEVPVEHTTIVTEKKVYRASRLDADGKVVESWEVTKCKFKVIGATLTDIAGNTFTVVGNIKIDPIK